jgi:elongator complex protein 3
MCGELTDREKLVREKIKLCSVYGLGEVPPNSAILAYATDDEREMVEPMLVKKPLRTMSGVAVVAVMTSPHPCPHGKCIYCPGGVESGSPQSYTGKEPAARRAARDDYDPFMQVTDRMHQLEAIGHHTDKIELIIMGGTFTCREPDYQEWFVRRCYDALNDREAPDVDTAQQWNATAPHRCVALTVETRPDVFDDKQIEEAMAMGATRVELGVQILDDSILKAVDRGHDVQAVIDCTKRCKTHGLAVCYHIMPGLPGSSPGKDLECFRRVFSDADFRPDNLKFYTTLVIANTKLYDMWKAGEYVPYDNEKAVALIADMVETVPEYARIQRIQRDIPAPLIAAGITTSNLRQLVQDRIAATGRQCRCIRCREVGRAGTVLEDPSMLKMNDLAYEASGGNEHFINLTYGDGLVGFLRLRIDGDEAIVREMKVFGKVAKMGSAGSAWQHRGFGKDMVTEAERIAREAGCVRVRATVAAGARGYLNGLGYVTESPYMVKRLR